MDTHDYFPNNDFFSDIDNLFDNMGDSTAMRTGLL
jgi:hypothetical protein